MAKDNYLVLIGKRRTGKPAGVPLEEITNLVEDYPNKVLAEVTANQHQRLLHQGYRIEDLSSRGKIRAGVLAIDPTIPEEREMAIGLPEEEETPESNYFFVQFVGPVKLEWLEELKKGNLVPLSYYHDFTYLVFGEATDVEKVAKKRFVRAVMSYTAEAKVSREAMTMAEDEDSRTQTREFWVLFFSATFDNNRDYQDLSRIGAEVVSREQARGPYTPLRVRMPASVVTQVARIPSVYTVEPYYPEVDEDEIANMIIATGQVPLAPPAGTHPYLDWLNDAGVDGTDVTIGIVEASNRFDENHAAFAGSVTNVTAQAAGNHATMVAGQAAGDYQTDLDPDGFIYGIGIAPAANLLNQWAGDGGDLQRCQDTVTNVGPNGENGTVQNNSWGAGTADPMNYQNREANYDQCVRDADAPTNVPLVICFSAGNSGNNGLTRPKGAKNIITTGNFENSRTGLFGCGDLDADNINERYVRACADSGTGESSVGNCADGRVKPDLVAPGQWTASASFGITAVNWPQRFINNLLAYGGGTSAASPKVAGASALIIQWWRQRHTVDETEHTPSPALVKAMLINSAVDTGEGGSIPNEEQGWGRVNLNNVFNPEVPTIYVNQEVLLQPTSPDVEFDIEPIDTNEPMRVTLVWTDVPGTVGSGTGADPAIPGDTGNPAMVNELGLEVARGTDTWFGNNFAGGWSQTGGQQDDIQNECPGRIVNNVQNVFIQNVDTINGPYHVRISPENIVGDCLDPASPYDNPADFRQDFALVIQNARLTTDEPVDVMLAIDRTGSMSGDRIAAAKASGQEFFDLIPTGADHRAGLVSYAAPSLPIDAPIDDKVTVDVDMDVVTNALKTNAQGLIGAITANGWTSIGAGLTKAMERVVDNGEPLHRKVIVLLSDGKENRPPYVSEVLPRLRKEYRVHAVGLGGSINGPLMEQIADDTNGTFLHTLDPDEIAPLYRELLALEADEEVVGHESGSFTAGEEEEAGAQVKRFPIVNSDNQVTFVVGWKNPDVSLDVELLTPRGETITPDKARRSRTKSHVKRDTHVIYTVRRPRGRSPDWEGEWAVRIRRATGSATAAETYTASALVRSSLRLMLLWDKARYFTGDLIRLKAEVIDKQFVLKDGVKMAIRTTVPLKGYGTMLASVAKKAPLRPAEDVAEGSLAGLDRLSEDEWQVLYKESEEETRITFEVGIGDVLERPAFPIFATPNVAKLKSHFRPIKDGIYTYRIKVEGKTASGARYTRVRTVSKCIHARADGKLSTVVLKPISAMRPKVLRLMFTPKDLNGNLVGPGRGAAIMLAVSKGTLRGEIEDLLDGSYTAEFEATDRPEDMCVTVNMEDVSMSVSVCKPVVPMISAPVPISAEKPEGKIDQLRFDAKGNFQGFTLRSVSGPIEFQSISMRLADVLADAMEKDLMAVVIQDVSNGEVTEIRIVSP